MSDNAPKVLLRSEQSDGHVAIVELTGGGRPPLHTHDFDEAFCVLEGELTFKLGDDVFTRRAGELAFAPRGVPHTYANLSGAPARALLVITPAGFERYFDRIAACITGSEPPPEATKPIPEVITVGPPLRDDEAATLMSPPEPAVGGPLNGVDYRRRRVGDANYLFALAGGGDAVLLLHGFPQTHYCWRELIPVLARSHRVVAPDLRGYGGSCAPAGGEHGEGFSKREVAADLVSLMDGLGLDRFAVVGHDRGARVAYRMALDHPDSVARLCVLNVVPTIDQFERMAGGPSLDYWPWFLLAQPAPFPEQLIAAAPEQLLRFIFDSWTADTSSIDDEAFAVYRAAFSPAAAAICGDYRASFWLDREHDEDDRRAGRRIECPTLLITGAEETQLADAADVWRAWAVDVRAATAPGGHFVPEEAPDVLAAELTNFLANRRR